MSVKELLEKVLDEGKKPNKRMKKTEVKKDEEVTVNTSIQEAVVDDLAMKNLPAKMNDRDHEDGYQHGTPDTDPENDDAKRSGNKTVDGVIDPLELDRYNAARNAAGIENQPHLVSPTITAESLSVDDDLKAIFKGQEFTPDFMSQVKTVYEASILTAANKALDEAFQAVVEAAEDAIEEETQRIYENLETKLDEYLSFIAEEWAKENKVATESLIRTQMTENFIKELKALLIEHSIDIPEDKIDTVNALTERVESLTTSNDKAIQEAVSARTELAKVKREYVVEVIGKDLSEMEKDKLTKLAESVDTSNDEDFVTKMVEIKNAYFTTEVVNSVEKDDGEALVNLAEETNGNKPVEKSKDKEVGLIFDVLTRFQKS